MQKPALIFVYNADGGIFNSLTDFAHKIISPTTYHCQLCALTYGNLFMKNEWKLFIEMLPLKTIFLHKNEFLQKYKFATSFPAIFIEENGVPETFLMKEQIDQCKTLKELKEIISSTLANHGTAYDFYT